MLMEQTLQNLSTPKLTGMKHALQQQLEQPQTYSLSFEERFSLFVDHEKTYRHDKKIERLQREAKLRQQACMEDIDYRHRPGAQA